MTIVTYLDNFHNIYLKGNAYNIFEILVIDNWNICLTQYIL